MKFTNEHECEPEYGNSVYDFSVPADERLTLDAALTKCINTLARVDLPYIAALTGFSEDQAAYELSQTGAIVQDPAYFVYADEWDVHTGWVLPNIYYTTGNLREKLKIATEQNARFKGCFDTNVEGLKNALPPHISIKDVKLELGMPISPKIIARFIKDLLDLRTLPIVNYVKELARWDVIESYEAKCSVKNNEIYGTKKKNSTLSSPGEKHLSAMAIILRCLNSQPVAIYKEIVDLSSPNGKKRVVDIEKTIIAQELAKKINRKFREWVYRDKELSKELETWYNETLTAYVIPKYDGSFLEFDDLNPDVNLYKYQRNGVARVLLSKENVLFAHDVGTGKTYIIVVSAHELKRKGLSEKTLIVVPKNRLEDTVALHRHCYPQDKLLVITSNDFSPSRREKALEKIRTSDHTAIYISDSSFNRLGMSKDFTVTKMREELEALRDAVTVATGRRQRSLLIAEHKKLSKKIFDYILTTDEEPYLGYDQLGITTLIVDEAHTYKNIPIKTRASNVSGMSVTGSQKCKKMLDKCSATDRVIFTTGTPLVNSIADVYTLQQYLQPHDLKFIDINSFDNWISCFAERTTEFETDIDGLNWRTVTRYSSFHNLPELVGIFGAVCDFHHTEENESTLPKFDGYTDTVIPRSSEQFAYMQELARRNEDIRAGAVSPTEDNPLKITGDGRKAATDIRLVCRDLDDFDSDNTKTACCSRNILELYRKYPDTCQVVFCDIGTPSDDFNLYDDLKEKLISLGIPGNEIAYAHDAKTEKAREKLFEDINNATVRVIIGSTSKLGVGVNIQNKLIALHSLDVPWRPADLIQREGRIIRQGNSNEKIYIYRYITEGSFDSYNWQILQRKQQFISDFLSCTCETRMAEDLQETVLNYAEIKALATGNPLVKSRFEIANKLERAKLSELYRQKQKLQLRAIAEASAEKEKELELRADRVLLDADFYRNNRKPIPVEERAAFGEELIAAMKTNTANSRERVFDSYQGFDIVLPAGMIVQRPHVYVQGHHGERYYLEMSPDTPITGVSRKIDHLLSGLTQRSGSLRDQAQTEAQRSAQAQEELNRDDSLHAEIEALAKELERIDAKLNERGEN